VAVRICNAPVLSWLKNKQKKAAKRSKASEKRCLEDETIDDCECEQKTFFGYVNLSKKRIGYPSVMHFEGHLPSGPDDICNLFAHFIQRTNADDVWVLSDLGPDLARDDPPFSAL
jgi:hypothetical protein